MVFPPQGWAEYQQRRESIGAILDERKWPLSWLDNEILNERATIIADDGGCVVVALRKYPGGLIEVHGLVAAGEVPSIKGLVAQAECWGRSHGAQVGSISSRRGWVKIMRDYRETQVTIEKELVDGTE